jgi:hypothetical protein
MKTKGAAVPFFVCARASEPVSGVVEPVSALAARPIPEIGKSPLETRAQIRTSETRSWPVSDFRPRKTPRNVGVPAV